MENDMAKGQLRSNREKKKPKADKSKSKIFYTGVAVGSDTFSANVDKALHRQEDLMRAEPDDACYLVASVWSATDRA
jgi:hypothetical protein